MKRRTVLTGGGAVALTGLGIWAMRPEKVGAMHDPYFSRLCAAVQREGINRPVLVIDQQRLNANSQAIRTSVTQAGLALRIVAKSLPAPQLLDAVMTRTGTQRLMVFSAQMLAQLAAHHPGADYLLGKPLPVAEFLRLVDLAGPAFAAQVQWLIDTPARLAQYVDSARARGITLRVSFEIDVGLHRGGFADAPTLAQAARSAQSAGAEIAGLMGYDPHVPKMPNPAGAYSESQNAYGAALAVLQDGGLDPARLTCNSAGSPTFRRHCQNTVASEVSVGSAFVKPGDFDYPDLADLTPAAFVVTPVLKADYDQQLPGAEAFSGAMHWWDRNTTRGFFIHGGHWLAKPVSPQGLQYSSLFGRSSNQELLTGSTQIDLKPDDAVVLRPDQSEALFLQFGDIAVFDGSRIAQFWPTLPVSA